MFPAGSGVYLSGNWRDPRVCPGGWVPEWATRSQRLWAECWGPSKFPGEGVIPDQRLPLAVSAGLFFLVASVMQGLLGASLAVTLMSVVES